MTAAENMLDLAREVSVPRDLLIVPEPSATMGEVQFDRIQLALDFERMDAAFKVRALVEGWDLRRVVREMY